MIKHASTTTLGRRFFGLGVMALGLVCLAAGDFVVGQPLPKDYAHRAALAYASAATLLATGAALGWRRTAAQGAASLAIGYLLIILLSDVPALLANARVYGVYSGVAEQFAILAAATIVFASTAKIDATVAGRLARLGQVVFGVCAVLFGGAHFVYMELTVPLVPRFLPLSQEFWAYATGAAHILAGLAIVIGLRAGLAAGLLTAMYASFTPLVHVPLLLAHPSNHANWSENAINLALTGAAWVVAASFRKRTLAPFPDRATGRSASRSFPPD